MTVKEVCAELDKIMKALQSVNIMSNEHRQVMQKNVNNAYDIVAELKKKLKEEHK